MALCVLALAGSIWPAWAKTDRPAGAPIPQLGEPIRHIAVSGSPSNAAINSIAFSPDGRFLAGGDGHGTLSIWESATARVHARWTAGKGEIGTVAFSRDGRTLVDHLKIRRGGAYQGQTQLWNVRTHRLIYSLPSSCLGSAAFSPDGRFLAVTVNLSYRVARRYRNHGVVNGCGVRIWDLRAHRWMRRFYADNNPYYEPNDFCPPSDVRDVRWSPDGKRLAAVAAWYGDGDFYALQMWDVSTGCHRHLEPHDSDESEESGVAFSRDGHLLGTVAYDQLRIYDALHRHVRRVFTNTEPQAKEWGSFDYSPDGRLVAVGAAGAEYRPEIFVWNVGSGRMVLKLRPTDTSAGTIAFSPDGRTLACSGPNGRIDLWRL
jgi:WD40 repeat protein